MKSLMWRPMVCPRPLTVPPGHSNNLRGSVFHLFASRNTKSNNVHKHLGRKTARGSQEELAQNKPSMDMHLRIRAFCNCCGYMFHAQMRDLSRPRRYVSVMFVQLITTPPPGWIYPVKKFNTSSSDQKQKTTVVRLRNQPSRLSSYDNE